ncbi:MAG: tRNA epoxyqueuosine(34) reductase QueG [Cellulosilyticum sp.]|nr:tRNA epoxyqueuosine(34) reductase QueG [Cellulosilyticum sp.]
MKQKIEAFCQSLGLDTMGFIPCRRFDELEDYYKSREEKQLQNEFEGKVLEERLNPTHYLENGKTILSIAFPYDYKEVEDQAYEQEENGFSIYTKRLDYHRVVKKYLDQIVAFIETLGGQAIALVDSNTLPERYIAYLAGVGFIGRNNMLITEKYGSYVFLGEIITDLEIPCQDQRAQSQLTDYVECGQCENCLRECPTKSIHKKGCNPNICLSYLTQKKTLEVKEIKLLKGNLFGCDFCQLKCPYNEAARPSVLEDFKKLVYMEEEPSIYAGMDNSFFKEKMSVTSCGWRGKNVIRRNAMIRMAYEGKAVEGYLGDSPYINEYIQKLMEIYNPKLKETES